MTVNTDAIGRTYPADHYAVGREKVKEYALAVGEHAALHSDHVAAQAAGFPDVVAPPMFVVVYTSRPLVRALFDPEVGIDFAHLVHGAQEFKWGPLVVAGDEITTILTVKDISERAGLSFYEFETRSHNQRDEQVCVGAWTNIVREG